MDVRDFYDDLADRYHLIYADWRNAVRRQGAVLDRLIRSHLGTGSFDVLDRACGIGTQAIGLALRGHRVRATDISAASVERARIEAKSFGVEIDLGVADMREPDPARADVVMACDNAVPHLVEDAELARGIGGLAASLRRDGLLVVSVRDYDDHARDRPTATVPQVFDDGARIVFQTWEWAPDGRTYDLTLFLLTATDGAWRVEQRSTRYRALLRNELSDLLAAAGLRSIRWHGTEETGFFQPIVTARA